MTRKTAARAEQIATDAICRIERLCEDDVGLSLLILLKRVHARCFEDSQVQEWSRQALCVGSNLPRGYLRIEIEDDAVILEAAR